MKKIVFGLPGNEILAEGIIKKYNALKGKVIFHQFPDGESYVRVLSNVRGKDVIVVCSLHQPDNKLLPLLFLCKLLKELKAKSICLIVPYLSYMRQDKQFKTGEAITSVYFANLLSPFADQLITIDPHLHRRHSMQEIYSIPCKALHASVLISKWIKENIKNALLIGPDSESEQWVSEVSKNAGAPFIILKKIRSGDRKVKISVPQIKKFKNHTPVLVDDIISTAQTMMKTIRHLKNAGMKPPVCIGVHAVFSGNSYKDLLNSGVKKIVTCNTIPHPSNGIDITKLL